MAVKQTNITHVAVAGGVSANTMDCETPSVNMLQDMDGLYMFLNSVTPRYSNDWYNRYYKHLIMTFVV